MKGLLFALALGCTPPAVRLDGHHTDYPAARDAWTRRGEVFEALGLQLALTATWRSEPLVEAQRSGFPELAPVQAGALEFFVTMHTREWAWNHLERPDGTFRVWLLVDGVRSEALRVVRHADRKGFEFVYPDVTNLRVAYDVVFPATALKSTSRSVQLLVGGPPGRVALEWRLAGTVGANGGAPRTHSIMEARRAAGSAKLRR